MPELENTPEVYDILLKYSMLNQFGSSYTLRNLEDESFTELILMQICMGAESKAIDMQSKRAQFYSKENL